MFSEKSPLFLSKVHRFLRKPVEFSQTFAHHLGKNRRWSSTSCGAALAIALLGGGMLTACNDFLDVSPDSELNVRIDSEAKIAELLTGAYPEASYIPFLEPRTDNVAERPNGQHTQLNEAMYFWEDYDQDDLDTPLNYWNACYKGIAQANKALELLTRGILG